MQSSSELKALQKGTPRSPRVHEKQQRSVNPVNAVNKVCRPGPMAWLSLLMLVRATKGPR